MIEGRDILGGIKLHYEKAIAFVVLLGLLASLAYLAVQVSLIRGKDNSWRTELEQMTPAYKDTDIVNEKPYEDVFAQIVTPAQINLNTWTNEMLTIPEVRASCVDCKGPIPFYIASHEGVCPLCFKKQPADTNTSKDRDLDEDGMKDVWEDQHGLDSTDGTDASKDKDNDLFTNLEEFNANTDPSDPKSYPPIEVKLYVRKIDANPFKLRFKSVMKIPPVCVVQMPNVDIKRFSVGSTITLDEDAVIKLPDNKEVKALAKSVLESLGGIKYKLRSGEDTIADFQLPVTASLIIPVSSVLAVSGFKVVKSDLPGNSVIKSANVKFALNLGKIRTYFKLLGETVDGFKLVKFENKMEKMIKPGYRTPRDVDVSELTLQRGDKRIVLVKGRAVTHDEYTVQLIFLLDDSEYKLKINDEFKLKDVVYKLISVDMKGESVLVNRTYDKQDFVIKMVPNVR